METGKIAYEAYCLSVGNKSVRGEELPTWEDQADPIKRAWNAAAEAVVKSVTEDTEDAGN